MRAKLVVVGGETSTPEIELRLPTILGRGREARLTLPHPLVSRQHCEIYEANGQLMVRDLGSLNGTFVANERITEAVLGDGQLLTVGTVTFRAVYLAADPQQPLEVMPGMPETVPNSAETVPSSAETVPNSAETVPDFAEAVPDLEETIPTATPVYDADADAEETVPAPAPQPASDQTIEFQPAPPQSATEPAAPSEPSVEQEVEEDDDLSSFFDSIK